MGTFTDNLLKLTEFPFSYSFIGVLVLIAGGKGFLDEEASLANLGPLLILMGFVATTLSIIDPVGVIQKYVWLRGLRAISYRYVVDKTLGFSKSKFDSISIFGQNIERVFQPEITGAGLHYGYEIIIAGLSYGFLNTKIVPHFPLKDEATWLQQANFLPFSGSSPQGCIL
jgi:hypothetical protein